MQTQTTAHHSNTVNNETVATASVIIAPDIQSKTGRLQLIVLKKSAFLLLLALALAPWFVSAQTNTTSGVVTNSETWSGTITLTGDITIGAGGDVTVAPGTIVRANAGSDDTGGGSGPSRIEIIVAGGSLSVNGTSNSPVLFTSASTNAAAGDWYGVVLQSGSLSLRQARIEYGMDGLTVAASATNAFVDCTITECWQNGVLLPAAGFHGFQDVKSFQNVQLIHNGLAGLAAPSASAAVLLQGGLAQSNGWRTESPNISCDGRLSAAGFQSRQASGWGIVAAAADLSGCVVSDNARGGVSLGGYAANTVDGCTINNNGGIGLAMGGGAVIEVYNCGVRNNAGDGING